MFTPLYNKLACCAMLMLLATAGLNAQWSYGAKAGLGLSHYITANDLEPQASEGRIGALGGLFAQWRPDAQKLGVRAELLYLEQGEKSQLFWPDRSVTNLQTRQQYLALPVLASYQIGPLHIEAGPQLAYLLNTTLRNEDDAWQNADFLDIPNFELAANAGLRLAIRRFELGLTYSRGLLNLNRDYTFTDSNGVPLPSSESPKSYNETLQLALGYRLIN